MNLKVVLFFIFFVLAVERIINMFGRKEPKGIIRYKTLTYALVLTYLFCILLVLLDFIIWIENINVFATCIGFLIIIISLTLRRASIMTLGNNWSFYTKEIKFQQLIRIGIYRKLRHPYYLAVILELIGICLFFNALSVIIFVLFVNFPLLLFRIYFEEKVLIYQFKEKYLEYQKETKFFL